MGQQDFSQVNTGISVREERFVTVAQFDQLLHCKGVKEARQILKGTIYNLEQEEKTTANPFEECLMGALLKEYQWAFEVSFHPDLVTLFTLPYVYHNLKVLLKSRATAYQLESLLFLVGPYSLEVLQHLVRTFSIEYCPNVMAQEVAATWQEYQDYKDLRVLEIGMDLAYFKHLKQLELNHPVLEQMVLLLIDFYNITTVWRAKIQAKPQSFVKQLLSDEGSLSADDYIQLGNKKAFLTWFRQINPVSFDLDIRSYEESIEANNFNVRDLEYLFDLLIFKLLEKGRYETDGPLSLARYLYGRELEVKNLRLVLTGLDNQIPSQLLKERMRPIYGQ